MEADSVVVNVGKLNGALPSNLKPDALLNKDTKRTSSSRQIRTADATPIRMKVDRAKPIWLTEYKPTWLVDNPNPVMIGDDNIDAESTQVTDQHVINEIRNTNSESKENVRSTEVIDQPEGTAASGTDQTTTSVAKSMLKNLPIELVTDYSTSSSEYEEVPRTETSSSINADSYVVNPNGLRGVVLRNLKVDVELSHAKTLPTTISSKPIRTTDAAPVSVVNSMTRSLEPVRNYSQSSVLEENSKTGEESMEYTESTQVTDQPKGTATVVTESTPMSVSNSMMISTQAEVSNYTQLNVIEEIPKTNTEPTENVKKVPRAIGAHVFYGKMVSGSEMYNMTTAEYYNKIYPTQNCDLFLIGKLLKISDTPHNRMVFAKFAEEEEADSTSEDSTEEDVPIDD